MKKEISQQEDLFQSSLILSQEGMNHGATGNLSCRNNDTFIITSWANDSNTSISICKRC